MQSKETKETPHKKQPDLNTEQPQTRAEEFISTKQQRENNENTKTSLDAVKAADGCVRQAINIPDFNFPFRLLLLPTATDSKTTASAGTDFIQQ